MEKMKDIELLRELNNKLIDKLSGQVTSRKNINEDSLGYNPSTISRRYFFEHPVVVDTSRWVNQQVLSSTR